MTQQELDDLVNLRYAESDGRKPMLDGAINIETYKESNPKILWILKEPYDKTNDGLGGWSLRDDVNENANFYFRHFPTWRKMGYVSFGILNNMTYEEARNHQNIYNALFSIAHINVSKCSGDTRSKDWGRLVNAFEKCHDVITHQIDFLNPDIIIMGGTAGLFSSMFKIKQEDKSTLPSGGCVFFQSDNRLIIDAYHPSYITNQAKYCNEIISTARDWYSRRK